MIICVMFLGAHFNNTRRIYLLGSGRGAVGGLGDAR